MTNSTSNTAFIAELKKYNEDQTYIDYEIQTVQFDPETLEVDNVTDLHAIIDELNKLSYKLFYYGSLCDSQQRVLQQLEDEFERWRAETLHLDGIEDKQYKTEKSKERYLMIKYPENYWWFKNNLSSEQFKLNLLQRVVKSLENYGYKLHALKDYNLSIEKNS